MKKKWKILSARPATRSRSLGRWLMVPALVITGIVSVASGSSASSRASGFGPGITLGILGDYDNLNPTEVVTQTDTQLDTFVYDTLLFQNNKGKLYPYLASSWTTTPTSVTFKIHKGATCSDGTPVTPAVVAASIKYYTAPSTAANEKETNFGPGPVTVSSSASRDTVTVSLTKPWAGLLAGFSTPNLSIICPAGLKDPATLKNTPEGSGPFEWTHAVRGDEYVLTARKGYNWGPEGGSTSVAGFPQSITVKVINDLSTEANLLTTNELSLGMILGPATPDVERLIKDTSLRHKLGIVQGADGLMFNQSPGRPGADPAVRHALELAVSASQYNTAQSYGESQVMKTIYTPNMQCYNPADGSVTPGYDPKLAKQILERDGWKPNASGKLEKDGKLLTIHIVGFTILNNGPAYLQTALDAIGVTAVLNDTDLSAWETATFSTGDWDVQDFPFASGSPNPESIAIQLSGTTPPKGFNVGFINNPAYNAEIVKAQQATSAAASCRYWDAAERIALASYDTKPLVTFPSDFIGQKSMSFSLELGFEVDPFSIRS